MEIQLFEVAQMWEKLHTGDFEAWVGWGQLFPEAQRRDFGRRNHTGCRNPEAFRIIDSLLANADPAGEDRLYRRLTEIYRADMPFTRLTPATREWIGLDG